LQPALSFSPQPAQRLAVPGLQAPFKQTSAPLQTLLSSHAAVLFTNLQPDAGSQESVVQTLESKQRSGNPPLHVPLVHLSASVQALPSLQAAVLFVNTQPVILLQVSVVQAFLSVHIIGSPPHTPAVHLSDMVQAFLSSHLMPVRFVW